MLGIVVACSSNYNKPSVSRILPRVFVGPAVWIVVRDLARNSFRTADQNRSNAVDGDHRSQKKAVENPTESQNECCSIQIVIKYRS